MLESYLTLNLSRSHKTTLTLSKFRIGNHKLRIETGRHTKPKIPPQQRICKTCNIMEDEIHFLVDCKLYSDIRNKYKLTKQTDIDSVDHFKNVMMYVHEDQINVKDCITYYCNLAKFLEEATIIRNEMLTLTC